MPNPIIKSFAKKSGKSEAEVEKIWDASKAEAYSKFKSENGSFWAYVNATVQHKLGLKEDKVRFKQFYNKGDIL